jgi:hypothetical protein
MATELEVEYIDENEITKEQKEKIKDTREIRDHLAKKMLDYFIPNNKLRRKLDSVPLPELKLIVGIITPGGSIGKMAYAPKVNEIHIPRYRLKNIRMEEGHLRTDNFSESLVHEMMHWLERVSKKADSTSRRKRRKRKFENRALMEFRADFAEVLTPKLLRGSKWSGSFPQFWKKKEELGEGGRDIVKYLETAEPLLRELNSLVSGKEVHTLDQLEKLPKFKELENKDPENMKRIKVALKISLKRTSEVSKKIHRLKTIVKHAKYDLTLQDIMKAHEPYSHRGYFISLYPFSKVMKDHPKFVYDDKHAEKALEKLKKGHEEYARKHNIPL